MIGWSAVGLAVVAYSAPGLYAGAPAAEGGGGGRYFTGSRRDGFTCAVCHVGGAPPALTIAGGPIGVYEPGAVYTFDLRVDPGALPRAALTAEVVDEEGARLGALELAPRDLLTDAERCAGGGHGGAWFAVDDGREVVALADCLARRLRFQWTAPEAGRGAAHVHVAAVAGDGEGTPADDGVAVWRAEVAEIGTMDAGCRATERGGGWLLVLLGWRLRGRLARRGGRRRGAMGLALAFGLLGSGCARVKPYERGRLAQPDMTLTGDEDLTAGQLHATEYREGSVGGEGGGGGGCGCN